MRLLDTSNFQIGWAFSRKEMSFRLLYFAFRVSQLASFLGITLFREKFLPGQVGEVQLCLYILGFLLYNFQKFVVALRKLWLRVSLIDARLWNIILMRARSKFIFVDYYFGVLTRRALRGVYIHPARSLSLFSLPSRFDVVSDSFGIV